MTPGRGDFGVVSTPGLAAEIIRWGTESNVNHAFLYVGDGLLIEARPGGAGYAHIDKYNGLTVEWSTGAVPLDDVQRLKVIAHARTLVGTPYGWLDILAIGLTQRRAGRLINVDAPPWWVRRVNDTHTLICSQLVDLAYYLAGVDLFTDTRLPGLVSPGDLHRLITNPPAAQQEAA